MKILHLSSSDINGGAARAAFRLHKGLIQAGVDSQMFVRDKHSDDKSVKRYSYPKGFSKVGYRYSRYVIENGFKKYQFSRPSGFEVFSDDRSALKEGFYDQLPEADIYHLHWISGFLDLPSFFRNVSKPVVWTLHDMFPFTGGCHYNSGCQNYLNSCHNCPQLGSKSENDLSRQIWMRKQKSISEFKNRIVIRTDSNWLTEEAKRSGLYKNLDISTIHYGLETDEFLPLDKMSCKQALNIPQNKRVIVFGAPGIDNPRKGFKELNEALLKISGNVENLLLLSFGSGGTPNTTDLPILHLGHVANNKLLSLIYNCGDVFVIPSLQEAFGQTALEAMACSVPVAGFNTGGIPDMIEDGVTGYLAQTGNISDLSEAILRILNMDRGSYEQMANNCRNKVLNGYTLTHQSEKYISDYRKLIG